MPKNRLKANGQVKKCKKSKNTQKVYIKQITESLNF